MNPESLPTASAADTLLELELRIARRADELTRTEAVAGPLNLHCWLVAEHEVLGPENQVPATKAV